MNSRINFDRFKPEEKKQPKPVYLVGSQLPVLSDNEHVLTLIEKLDDTCWTLWASFGQWSMHDLLLHLLNLSGKATLHISTYACSETAARTMAALKADGMIAALHLIIDDRVDVRSPNASQLLTGIADTLVYTSCHAKLTVIEGVHRSFVVCGSANYTENKRFESGFIASTQDAIDFYKNAIIHIMNHHGK